jgi:catechol 2,3-dioxygenase
VGERELLVLIEEPGARPSHGYAGLYHDHFVSEAVYLSDPDGHRIEIYWDRPREIWEGQVADRMTTLPLDVESLLGSSFTST